MPFTLFNTLTREKEEVKPIDGKTICIYSCGPTVYDYPHIGNYRAYISSDILKRYLRYKKFHVKHVMNITDVDDKTIKRSREQGKSLQEFTRFYEKGFFEDLETLRISPPDTFTRATEYIKEMVEIIEGLLKNGLAYKAEDGIYFSVAKFPDYGKLANLDLSKLKEGASGRVARDEYDKETVHDFALWKFYDEADGDVFWETSIGKGRPGWHIECSAMSMKELGKSFDIHTGGIDLIFPHHQNEIAQSEGFTETQFVKHWMHNEWLLVEGEKMSKSKGNFYTLRDILKKGYDAMAVRYLLLSTHYRQQLNFTFDGLEAAKHSIERLEEFVQRLKKANHEHDHETVTKLITDARAQYEAAMNDDLNISEALAVLFNFVRDVNKLLDVGLSRKDADDVLDLLEDINEVLGVITFTEETITSEQTALIEQREIFRKEKNFAEADKVRDELLKQGIELQDTPSGVRWKKLK